MPLEHYLFGKDACYYLWDEDYANLSESIIRGEGTLVSIQHNDNRKEQIICNSITEFKVFKKLNQTQLKSIESKLKLNEKH
jgi:hypothetical protein